MADLLHWGVQIKSRMIDRGPHRVNQATLDIRSGEKPAPETWIGPWLRKPFSKKIKLSRWFKHMFLILIKYLFSLEKNMLQENGEKTKYQAKQSFLQMSQGKSKRKMCLQGRLCPYFGNLFSSFLSLLCVEQFTSQDF